MAENSIKSSHLDTHSRMYKTQSHEVPSGVEPMNTVYKTKEYDLFIVPGLEEYKEDEGKQRDIEEAQVDELIKNDLVVAIGSDNIHDVYKPYCNGDMMFELRMLLEACKIYDEDELVKIATINGKKVLGLI